MGDVVIALWFVVGFLAYVGVVLMLGAVLNLHGKPPCRKSNDESGKR